MMNPSEDGSAKSAQRTGDAPADGLGRRSFLRGGLLAGAATAGLVVASSAAFTSKALAGAGLQGDWFWCSACTMIYHSGSRVPAGACAVGANFQHNIAGSSQYAFDFNGNAGYTAQSHWTWCNKCQVLFYGPDISTSQCYVIGGGTYNGNYNHTAGSTTSYQVATVSVPGFQGGWNYCPSCRSLFHGSGHRAGFCIGNEGQTDTRHIPYPSSYWVNMV